MTAPPDRGSSTSRRPHPESRASFLRDLVAGITVGVAQVGNTMAYAILAGVPPVHGLYAAMTGTPVSALGQGSQRMTSVPTAALCLAAGAALMGLPADQRVAGLLVLTMLTGIVMLAAGLLRAGVLVRFIEDSVMAGFMAGVSVQIVLGQLAAFTGVDSDEPNKARAAAHVLGSLGDVDPATLLTGVAAVALILVLRRSRARLFAMATSLVAVTAVVAALGLSVDVVGDIAPIPRSLPAPHLPDLSLAPRLLVPALSLAIIALVQAAGIRATVPNADGRLGDQDRDFVGQGAGNIVAGLFGGAALGGSVNATALNVGAGSRTRWSSVLAGVVVLVVVLAAAPLVEQVPLAVTAGILMVAAVSMLDPHAIREIWRADRASAIVMVATFVLVLVIPLQYAVLAGAAMSVIKHVYLSSLNTRVVQIVIDDDGRPREAGEPPVLRDDDVTVLDIYGSTFFGAVPRIRDSLPAVGQACCAVVVLRLRGRQALQSSMIALVRDYAAELAAAGGRLYLAGVDPQVQEQLRRTGLLDELGPDAVVQASDEFYGSCELAQRRGREWLRGRSGERR